MEPKCEKCEQYISKCICDAVARFFANVPMAPVSPAPAPRPIAIRSLQRIAATVVVGLVAGSVSACGNIAASTPRVLANDTVVEYAEAPRCEPLQGPYGIEFRCPNGGYGFVRYRQPNTMPEYMGIYNPWPARQ